MLSKIKSKAKSYRIEQFVEFIGSVKETEEFYEKEEYKFEIA